LGAGVSPDLKAHDAAAEKPQFRRLQRAKTIKNSKVKIQNGDFEF
jgi:hypothetical protein